MEMTTISVSKFYTVSKMAASLVRKLPGTLLANLSYQGRHTGTVSTQVQKCLRPNNGISFVQRCLSHWTRPVQPKLTTQIPQASLPGSLVRVCQPFVNSVRTVVRYSIRRGKPKTVRAITARFFRLPWGIYIRPRSGRHKGKWRKPDWINERGKYHVFCNKVQSRMFDKMTTQYWKKRRYYVNDPYGPYYQRTGMGDYTPPKFLP